MALRFEPEDLAMRVTTGQRAGIGGGYIPDGSP